MDLSEARCKQIRARLEELLEALSTNKDDMEVGTEAVVKNALTVGDLRDLWSILFVSEFEARKTERCSSPEVRQ